MCVYIHSKMRHVRLSARIDTAHTGRIYMKFDTGEFYENCVKIPNFSKI